MTTVPGRPGRAAVVAALVAACLVLAGCFAPPWSRAPRPWPTAGPDGTIAWRECPEVAAELVGRPARGMTYHCGSVAVPRDWTAPETGGTFEIAVLRVRADDQHDRIGSLLVNPGGPGASGVDLAVYQSFGPDVGGLPRAVTGRFDIVGFDPRGVRRSAPVECLSDEQLDESVGADPDPVSRAAFDAVNAAAVESARACGARYGETLRLYSTEQAARDMEAIRAAVGDPKLSYLGYSYGSLLGATYAQLFPARVRAMVLDGAVDPRHDAVAAAEGQAKGFERAFDNFAAWCAATPGRCPIAPDARAAVTGLMAEARRAPGVGDDGRRATAGWVFHAVLSALYSRSRWSTLATAVAQARDGDPAGIFDLADAYLDRDDDGSYSNLFDAYLVVACADEEPVSAATARRLQAEWRERYPLFGAPIAAGLASCAPWPTPPDPLPAGPATGAPPIVVVGTTGDPATPYEDTAGLAELLGVGVVVTVEGEGHTAYPESPCVTAAVDAYLVELVVPRDLTTCPA